MSGPAPDLPWHVLISRMYQDRTEGPTTGSDEETAELRTPSAEVAWQEFAVRVHRLAALALRWQSDLEPDDLDDLAQEVVIRFLDLGNLDRLRAARAPASYLVITLRNEARNLSRSRRRSSRAFQAVREELFAEGAVPRGVDVVDDAGAAYAEDTPEGHAIARLRSLLWELPPDDQELLRDRFWRGRSIAELAASRGIKYSAMAVRLFRILRSLRARMQ